MRKFFNAHIFEIFILSASLVGYLILKDLPYFGIVLTIETIFVLLWIELIILFKLSGDRTIQVSLWFFFFTIVFAVLGLSLVDTVSIIAFYLFILGSLQLIWEMIRRKKTSTA